MFRASALKADQREILRDVADGKNPALAATRYLVAMELVKQTKKGASLTSKGKRVHREVMDGGDGPESLKDLLSF